MKKYWISCFLLVTLLPGVAQTLTSREHSKYWYYRQRLVTEFLAAGEESPITCDWPSGYSIPAHQLKRAENGEIIQFGEGPLNLGWYIAVLATEYRLLSIHGQSTTNTLQELYYALKTYERLDRKAERIFWPHNVNTNCSSGNYNGLFGRDDVYQGFGALANSAFLARLTKNRQLGYESYLQHQRENSGAHNSYGSPDQISGMLLGCALVREYLPSSVTVQGASLRSLALTIAEKIGDRLASKNWWGRVESGNMYKHGDTFRNEFVAYGFAGALDFITDKTTRNVFGIRVPYYRNSLDESLPAQEIGWKGRANRAVLDIIYNAEFGPFIPIPGIPGGGFRLKGGSHDFTVAYSLLIAAVGDSWGLFTGSKLYDFGKRYDMEIYHLIFDAMHHSEISSSKRSELIGMVASALVSAPGEGPYSFSTGPNQGGVTGWRATNRWWRSRKAGDGSGGDPPANARFKRFRLHAGL